MGQLPAQRTENAGKILVGKQAENSQTLTSDRAGREARRQVLGGMGVVTDIQQERNLLAAPIKLRRSRRPATRVPISAAWMTSGCQGMSSSA
jgi:hypothetical protein